MIYEAEVAESADALDSGSSEGNFVEVQVLSTAPKCEVVSGRLRFFIRETLFLQPVFSYHKRV